MTRRGWTASEDAELSRRYPSEPANVIASDLGRGIRSIYMRARLLGLKKLDGWMAETARKHWANGRHEGSRAAHFKKGQTPFNKGRPMAEWMPADARQKCSRTQFRAGQLSGSAKHNWVPVGTEKIREGQLCRKVTDDPAVYPAARWQPVSRLVWEAEHGPIPPGHVVRFRDGMATTHRDSITLDRLELVTRAENMRRNSYHTRYPKEVAQLIQLRGAMNRKINNRSKA